MSRGLTPQSDLGTIYSIHAWFSSRCAARRNDHVSGQKAEFHQTPSDVLRQFQPIKNSRFTFSKLSQALGGYYAFLRSPWLPIDSHLQYGPSILLGTEHVKDPALSHNGGFENSIPDCFSPRYNF